MQRRLVIVVVVVAVVTIAASVWRSLGRAAEHTPVALPCLELPGPGWVTAQSERSLLRLEWDGDGGGQLGVAPEGDALVVWTPMAEVEARRVAREVTEPLRSNVRSDSLGRVSLLVACDAKLSPWAGVTTEVASYRTCLDWPIDRMPECVAEVREDRRSAVDWRAGAVGQRIDSESQKRGLVLRARDDDPRFLRARPGTLFE